MYCRVFSLAGAVLVAGIAAAPVAAKINMQPGMYDITSKLIKISGPDITPALMKQMLAGPPERKKECLTENDMLVSSGTVLGQPTDGCAVKNASLPGRLNVTTQCSGGASQKLNGTYTATSFAMTVVSTNSQGAATMTASGKRVGDCS